MSSQDTYHELARKRAELDPEPRPRGFDEVLRMAFFAGCKAAGGISSNKRSEAAFQRWRKGAFE
jgi:hypothetical protein